MPLFRKTQLSSTTSIGVWKIEESAEILKANLQLSQGEEMYYAGLRSQLRRQHWLSYRNILKNLVEHENLALWYDEFGKPHFENINYHLSVTHSGDFSAAIVSSGGAVGIDIEKIRDRIERVKERFLSEQEQTDLGNHKQLEKLYIYWGAKESLYKIYGKPEIEFSRDIIVKSFDFLPDQKGQCVATMTTPEGSNDYPVSYEKINDYLLIYVMGEGSLR